MPFTEQQLTLISATFDSLPDSVKALFNSASTSETAQAIAGIVAQRRQQGMATAVSGNVAMTVSNWTTLKAAAQVADSATLPQALSAFRSSLEAESATTLGPNAIAVCFAALKHFPNE